MKRERMSDARRETSLIWPAAPSKNVGRFFHWLMPRMFQRSFNAVRMARGTESVLTSLDSYAGPVIVVMNHQSWWDPVVAMFINHRLTPTRQLLGPMELSQLRKFAILRKLGVFGIEPDHPQSQPAMIEYLAKEFALNPKLSFWVTPQGQFADARDAIRIRPGVASVAARHSQVRVVSLAVEMAFWLDKRPEVLCRACEVSAPEVVSTTGWTRAIGSAMQSNADALAELVRARDESAFTIITASKSGTVNPLYDLWLRLRGVSGRVVATDRDAARARRAEEVGGGGANTNADSQVNGARATCAERASS